LLAAEISDQPIDAARDVAKLEPERRHSLDRAPDVGFLKIGGVMCQVLAHLREGVKHRHQMRGNALNRASEPWFGSVPFSSTDDPNPVVWVIPDRGLSFLLMSTAVIA